MYAARQPPQLPAANRRRLAERRDAERRRDELFDQAINTLQPYVFGELSGQPIPDDVKARHQALEQAAKAIEIPPYL
jgi:hypothetical protein